MKKSKLNDWFCKECDAHYYWLIYGEETATGRQTVEQPKTKKDWKEAILMTDLGMNHYEFYAVGENGIELNQEPCKKCLKKIKNTKK